jgi:hypothetical protein
MIYISLFCIVLVSFLANPAPVSIEAIDLILIILPLLIGFYSLIVTRTYRLYPTENHLLIAATLYLSYLLLSLLAGLLHGVALLNVLRSIGPYINFFPLLLLGFLSSTVFRPSMVIFTLITVGIFQIIYLIYLYFTYSGVGSSTLHVLINRITFIDRRTTLPLFLSVTILPIAFSIYYSSSGMKNVLINLLSIILILMGFFAGIITLTRSIFLSIIFGWIVYLMLYLYYQSKMNSSVLLPLIKKISIYLLCFICIILLMSCFKTVQMIESGLFSRFSDSSHLQNADFSNGRLYDEWIPALTTWVNSDILGILFGIGAGYPFIILSGEERTYIHNLCIYNLVYGGFYGLLTCLLLYLVLLKTLIYRAFQTQNIAYLAFAALLMSMFFYAQFFAVHKGFAFNVMLFLIMAIALCRPVPISNSR